MRAATLCRAMGLALALTGCSRPPAAPAPQPDAPSRARVLSVEEIDRLVKTTARARRLAEKRPVMVHRLSPERFSQEVSQLHDDDAGDGPALAGFLLGFNLIPPPAERAGVSSVRQVLSEQVVGFYDKKRDAVFVQAAPFASPKEELTQRAVLAHEVHHALQAQHFRIRPLSELPNDDARLAYHALIEGDAMVAMAAYIGAEYGAPLKRTLRAITDVTKQVALEDVAHDSHLARALPITRELLTFPYFEGMRFVADIYRAGGFRLVDWLYDVPPVSTAQILHPEKLVAGITPAIIDLPPAPAGHTGLVEGTLGELQTMVVLAQCHPIERARAAAAGWAGDAYRVLERDGDLSLAWLSVWDSEQDARELEAALTEGEGCWQDNRVAGDHALSIAGGITALRRGTRVAAVRGSGPEVKRWLTSLLDAAVVIPAPKPVSTYRIPERLPLPKPKRGVLRGDVYVSRWLGIQARIPSGMQPRIDTRAGLELKIDRPGTAVSGGFMVTDRITTGRFVDKAFADVFRGFAEVVEGHPLILVTNRTIRIPLGTAIERTWQVGASRLQLRAVLLPICQGTGSLLFVQAYADDMAYRVVDGWLRSFRWLRGGKKNAPVCRRLNPQ